MSFKHRLKREGKTLPTTIILACRPRKIRDVAPKRKSYDPIFTGFFFSNFIHIGKNKSLPGLEPKT